MYRKQKPRKLLTYRFLTDFKNVDCGLDETRNHSLSQCFQCFIDALKKGSPNRAPFTHIYCKLILKLCYLKFKKYYSTST